MKESRDRMRKEMKRRERNKSEQKQNSGVKYADGIVDDAVGGF